MANHKWDDKWNTHPKEAKKQHKESDQRNNNDNSSGSRNQNSDRKDKMQLTQKEKTCHCCGQMGHIAPDCPNGEKTPRNEWHTCKAVRAHQNDKTKEKDKPQDKETLNNKKVKWSATTQRQFCQKIESKPKSEEEDVCVAD